MPEPDIDFDFSPIRSLAPRRKRIRMTPAKLRAQRANALLSTGPRTPAGRRRAALNRSVASLSVIFPGEVRRLDDSKDCLRIWRDLLSLFWFVEPISDYNQGRLEMHLTSAALVWWGKYGAAQRGIESSVADNRAIAERLSLFIDEFRVANRKWRYWLRKEFGTDGSTDIGALRESIEARLGVFRDLRASRRPHVPAPTL